MIKKKYTMPHQIPSGHSAIEWPVELQQLDGRRIEEKVQIAGSTANFSIYEPIGKHTQICEQSPPQKFHQNGAHYLASRLPYLPRTSSENLFEIPRGTFSEVSNQHAPCNTPWNGRIQHCQLVQVTSRNKVQARFKCPS